MIDIDTTYVGIMAVNNKPILSILIDDEKRSRFAALAKDNKKSMGWIVNQAIDRMLEADSIEMFLDSEDKPTQKNQQSSTGLSIGDVEKLIKTSIDSRMKTIEKNQQTSIGLSVENIKELIKTSVETHTQSIEENQQSSIELSIDVLKGKMQELELYTQTQIDIAHKSITGQKILHREDLQVVANKLERLTTSQAHDIKGLHERLCVAELAIDYNRDNIKTLKTATTEQPAPIDSVEFSIKDLIAATGKTRQAIEKLRNEGRLATIGYSAVQDGRNWRYRKVEMLSESM